jgi:hypothetical protein
MSLPNAKELKKLAKACRAAGIKHFKNSELEFTLTDDLPARRSKKGQTAKRREVGDLASVIAQDFEAEEIGQDALLMWSALPQDGGEPQA